MKCQNWCLYHKKWEDTGGIPCMALWGDGSYNYQLHKKSTCTLPTQWEMIEVSDSGIAWNKSTFICVYKEHILVEFTDWSVCAWKLWRYPKKETVTLKDGKTYFVEERDGEKVLILNK